MKQEFKVLDIVNTHGTRGEVKALYFTDNADDLLDIKDFELRPGSSMLHVDSVRVKSNCLIIKFLGIDSIEDAESLKGKSLYILRSQLPPLPEGRFYIEDLIGLSVITDEGVHIGNVKDVLCYPRNDILLVNGEREILIPITDEFILEYNISDGNIVIKWMEGL